MMMLWNYIIDLCNTPVGCVIGGMIAMKIVNQTMEALYEVCKTSSILSNEPAVMWVNERS